MHTEDLVLGVDAGTSVVKTALFRLDGSRVAARSVPLEVHSPDPLSSETDMEDLWRTVADAVASTLDESGSSGDEILAIGVTGQGDGCWLVGRDGRPVRQAILWNDGRAVRFVREWLNDGTARAAFSINGSVMFPGGQAAIFRWLQAEEPEVLERSEWAIYCKDWLNWNLTREIRTDASDASFPFFAIRERRYDPRLLDLYGVADLERLLPSVRSTTELAGHVVTEAAGATRLPAGTPVVAAPYDVVCSGLGVGAIKPGEAVTILGTTCLSEVTLDGCRTDPPGLGSTVCHWDPRYWVRMMGAMTGTPNVDWFVEELGGRLTSDGPGSSQARLRSLLEAVVSDVPPGAGGVLYHPYLSSSGERAPVVAPAARAQFAGLDAQHTAGHLLRAVLEGVALSIQDCYAHLPVEVSEIRLVGGGARSPGWCQIISDVTGMSVVVPAVDEAGVLGAALNAAVAVGAYGSFEEAVSRAVRVARRHEPDPSNAGLYADLYGIYRDAREAMEPIWDRHQSVVQRHRLRTGGASR